MPKQHTLFYSFCLGFNTKERVNLLTENLKQFTKKLIYSIIDKESGSWLAFQLSFGMNENKAQGWLTTEESKLYSSP